MQAWSDLAVSLVLGILQVVPGALPAAQDVLAPPPAAVVRPAAAAADGEPAPSVKASAEALAIVLSAALEPPAERWLADDARVPGLEVDLDAIIEREARKNKVDPLLIATIVKYESGGDPNAESWVGAKGLMQMMPETAAEMGVADPADPEQNIAGGARYFGLMMEIFGDPRLALAAYNAGPGAVQEYGGIPPYEETRHYVRNIYSEYVERSRERGEAPTGWSS